jgi:hypothetical protein
MQQQNPITYLASKRTYKKLGTILEHIALCIDPRYYYMAVTVTAHYPRSVNVSICTIPTPVAPQSLVVSIIPWMEGCNGQLYINPAALYENAEW